MAPIFILDKMNIKKYWYILIALCNSYYIQAMHLQKSLEKKPLLSHYYNYDKNSEKKIILIPISMEDYEKQLHENNGIEMKKSTNDHSYCLSMKCELTDFQCNLCKLCAGITGCGIIIMLIVIAKAYSL